MKYLDLTLQSAAENLALDEVLLKACDEGAGPPVLRLWEPSVRFVVVGFSNRVATEVNVEACEREGIAIQRRITGGGTILQGPGCLNFALVLPTENPPALGTIAGANRFILERNARALSRLVGEPVSLEGDTDLAIGELKISGNAQRRKRSALLFHGTVLLRLNTAEVGRFLASPSREPSYRQGRPHGRFIRNLGLPAGEVKAALRDAWQAWGDYGEAPEESAAELARSKYSQAAWIWRQ